MHMNLNKYLNRTLQMLSSIDNLIKGFPVKKSHFSQPKRILLGSFQGGAEAPGPPGSPEARPRALTAPNTEPSAAEPTLRKSKTVDVEDGPC